MDSLLLELYQFDPALEDVTANAGRIADRAAGSDASLFVTPELSLTGYDIGEASSELARPVRIGQPLEGAEPLAAANPAIVAGLPEIGDNGVVYNTLALLEAGIVRFRHRKMYLPTYGMFDEGRFYGRGDSVDPFEIRGWRIGFLVCEDFWHPGLAYVLSAAGIDVLVVISAAPGRGGGIEDEGPRFANMEGWMRLARTTAQLYGIWVALANRCGVEGGTTYGGGSLVVAPHGDVVSRASAFEETVLSVKLTRESIERARRPAAHVRDEDVRLMRALLNRLDV
jgi:predicted amidohydrolase